MRLLPASMLASRSHPDLVGLYLLASPGSRRAREPARALQSTGAPRRGDRRSGSRPTRRSKPAEADYRARAGSATRTMTFATCSWSIGEACISRPAGSPSRSPTWKRRSGSEPGLYQAHATLAQLHQRPGRLDEAVSGARPRHRAGPRIRAKRVDAPSRPGTASRRVGPT